MTVWPSFTPGSVKCTASVVLPPSSMVSGVSLAEVTEGATLVTVTRVAAAADPAPASMV